MSAQAPKVAAWQRSDEGNSVVTSSWTLTAPSGIAAGNLLLAVAYGCVENYYNPDFYNTPSGWTELVDYNGAADAGDTGPWCQMGIWYKWATGSEGNITISSNANTFSAGHYLRITGANRQTSSILSTVSRHGTHELPAAYPTSAAGVDMGKYSNNLKLGFFLAEHAAVVWQNAKTDSIQQSISAYGVSAAFNQAEVAAAGNTGSWGVDWVVNGYASISVCVGIAPKRRVKAR